MGTPQGYVAPVVPGPELVAAIVAAVAACMDMAPESYRISAIRPAGSTVNIWALAGRLDQQAARVTFHEGRWRR